jgi:uncharacterized membrane protein
MTTTVALIIAGIMVISLIGLFTTFNGSFLKMYYISVIGLVLVGLWFIGPILILLAVIGSSVYFFYQSYKQNKNQKPKLYRVK